LPNSDFCNINKPVSDQKCIFCAICRGEKDEGEEILYRDKDITVFKDNQPRTPIHLLITPNKHYLDYNEMMEKEPHLLEKIGKVVKRMVDKLGLKGKWYTWGFHCGGKQSVHHIHAQLLAGMKPDELVL